MYTPYCSVITVAVLYSNGVTVKIIWEMVVSIKNLSVTNCRVLILVLHVNVYLCLFA